MDEYLTLLLDYQQLTIGSPKKRLMNIWTWAGPKEHIHSFWKLPQGSGRLPGLFDKCLDSVE